MRQIDFSDGYETAAAPSQGVITTGGFGSYSSDANFVTALIAAGGTLTAGHAYYNSVEKRIRFYDGSRWVASLAEVSDALFFGDFANDAAYVAYLTSISEPIRAGAAYFNTTDSMVHYYDGTSWHSALGHNVQATVTNKDIDLGTASSVKRITVSKGTLAALTALPRKAGTVYYATDATSIYYDDGTSLISAFSAPVSSVNGYAGVVVLVTDDIAEGSTNLYYTLNRLKANNVFKYPVTLAETTTPIALTGSVPLTIDGVTVANGNRILLAAQSSQVDDGIYDYSDNGSTYTLVRSFDADGNDELWAGSMVFVQLGTSHAKSFFYLDNYGAMVVGASNLPFTKLNYQFVEDAINNGVIEKAPSENAVFDALALKESLANKGAANGYCPLDASSLIPLAYFPSTVIGAVDYIGTWNANTNSPDLPGSTPDKGDYYVVSVAGTTSLGGITDWQIGDWAIFNGTVWEKVDNSESVTSVNGFTGAVVLDTDDIAEGATNLYFTDARAKAAAVADIITDGITDVAPSQNAVYDALAAITGAAVTSLTGDVTGTGPGATATTIAVGAVTDAKGSLANKPSAIVVATTNQTLSGTPTIDGQATASGDIILLTGQTTGSENGPWVAAAGAWSRPTWYPSGGTTQAFQFITILVRLGTTYAGSTWRLTTSGAITIDTTSTAWGVIARALNSTTTSGVLPETRGGTNQSTYTTGDTLYASASNTLSKRAIGNVGQFSRVSGGVPTWQDSIEPTLETRMFDDFITDAVGVLRWLDSDTSTGVSQTDLTVQDNAHPGVVQLATGTTNGAIAARSLLGVTTGTGTAGFQLGNGEMMVEWLVNIPTLATVTDDYRIDLGLVINHGLTVAQLKIQYSRASTTNWRAVAQSASVSTTLDLGIAVATGWTKCRMVINAAGTSAEFFINGVSGGTISSNLPSSTENVAPHFRIIKASASAVSHIFYVDYFRLTQRFTTPRT